MNVAVQSNHPVRRSHWATYVVVGLALAVLGATLAWSAFDLRERVRSQITQRDGEILDAVTVMQHLNDQEAGQTLASLSDPGEQFQLALEVSKLRNVLGVRLYDATGKFLNAFPAYITENTLPDNDLIRLKDLQPVSRYLASARMQEEEMLAGTNDSAALLLVTVPLRTDDSKQLAGAIQFIMDGSGVARRFAELDGNLALKVSAVFIVGAGILLAGLGLAMQRVQKANRLLAERTQHLLQANRELALSARMSAVGSVTAHLIHGLKNPLSGLANFVSSQRDGGGNSDWQMALSTTQRMQEMLNRVVRVLQEQQSGVEYELSAGELTGLLAQKARAAAGDAGVKFETVCDTDEMLSNREADLILLVLENLVMNGIEATPRGKQVRLGVCRNRDGLVFYVSDQGYGMPANVAANLFTPCVSGKKGGVGIGLAISKQIAQQLGATLELAASSTAGCVFSLTVPVHDDSVSHSGAKSVFKVAK